MSFDEDIASVADDLFAEAGVLATYSRGADTLADVPVITRKLTVDDVVEEHVRADAMVCKVRESDLHPAPFNRQPLRLDVITMTLPPGEDGAPRTLSLEVAGKPVRTKAGVWALICNQNIRLVP